MHGQTPCPTQPSAPSTTKSHAQPIAEPNPTAVWGIIVQKYPLTSQPRECHWHFISNLTRKWKPRDHGRPRKPAKLPLVVRTALPRRPPRRLGALPRFRCCVTLQNFEYVGDLQDPVPRVVFQPKGFYWYIFVFISVSAISQSIASRSARVSESGPENVENDGSAQAMDWPHRPSTS